MKQENIFTTLTSLLTYGLCMFTDSNTSFFKFYVQVISPNQIFESSFSC